MSEMLRDDEVTVNRIEALAKQAFMSTDRDKDGDLYLREGGMRTFVKVDTARKMITFFTAWGLRSRFSMEEKLQFANGQNDDKILVRFTVPQPDTLWCDYALLYEGGITPFNIINTYKRFVAVCRGVVDQDEKGLLGDD
jgi:hypothetical protein